jgi:hypothetical protein
MIALESYDLLTHYPSIARICQMSPSLSPPAAPSFLASEAAFAEFVERFERGTWPKAHWTHSAHLAVACWYLMSLPKAQAISRVRDGIRSYNQAVGTANTPDSGYHETLTLFWMETIGRALGGPARSGSVLEAARQVVVQFGSRSDLFRDFYTFDIVKSREARAKWVPPDAAKNPWEQE